MKHLLLIFCVSFATLLTAQDLVSVTLQESLSRQVVNLFTPTTARFGIRNYRVIYTMPNAFGVETQVSGLLTVPYDSDNGEDFAFPLAVYNHGTSGTRQSVPSVQGVGERVINNIIGSQGYITLAPDYLGLGVDDTGVHPYVHADTEASAGRNMIRAVKTWLNEQEVSYNDQLFITGYSQGGHASAALHRDIQLNPGDDGLTVTAAAHLSGPYSISGVMANILIEGATVTLPGYLAYTYISYNEIYGIYDDLGAVFVEPYLTPIRAFAAGTTELNDINAELFSLLDQENADLQDIFQDSIIDILANQPEHPINAALRDNDVYEWAPSSPTVLVYCTEDEQVPFRNAILADSVMSALGSATVQLVNGGALTHGGCVEPALTFMLLTFDSFASVVNSVDNVQVGQLSLSPNPVSAGSALFLANSFELEMDYELITTDGKIISRGRKAIGANQIDLPVVPAGLYYLRTRFGGKVAINKVVVE